MVVLNLNDFGQGGDSVGAKVESPMVPPPRDARLTDAPPSGVSTALLSAPQEPPLTDPSSQSPGQVLDLTQFNQTSPGGSIVEQPGEGMTPLELAKGFSLAASETVTGLVSGAVAWLPSIIAKYGQVGFHKLNNAIARDIIEGHGPPGGSSPELIAKAEKILKSPKEIQAIGRESEELISSYFGAAQDPTTPSAQKILDKVGQAIHFVTTPARKLAEQIPEKHPNLRDFVQSIGELATFTVIPKVGKAGKRKIKAINKLVREKKYAQADAKVLGTLKKLVKDKPELAKKVVSEGEIPIDLTTPEARQKAIDKLYGETLNTKQQDIINSIQKSELGTIQTPESLLKERGELGQKNIERAVLIAKRNKLLKNERGELTLEGLEAKERDVIINITRKAATKGIDLKIHLKNQGVGNKEIKAIIKLSKELKLERPHAVEVVPQKAIIPEDPTILSEGEVRVNTGKKANKAVPVGEKFLNELQSLKRTKTPGIIKGFITSLQGFNKLKNPTIKRLYTKWKVANKNRFNESKVIQEHIKSISKEFPKKKLREEVGAKGLAQTTNGVDALQKMGITAKENAVKYDPLLQKLEPLFEDLYNRLNEMRISIGKKPLKKLNNYLPFFAQENFFDTLNSTFKGSKEVTGKPNVVMDSTEAISYRHSPKVVEATTFAHTKRGKLRKGTRLELDPLRLYARYSNTALDHIHMSPINAFVKEITTKNLKDPKTGKNFNLAIQNREVANFLGQWSNSIAGVSNLQFKGAKFLDKAAKKISNNLTAATLHFSIRTMLVQPTALLPTATEFGIINTSKGLMRTITRSKKDPIKLSNELDPRVFDAFINDVAVEFGGTPIEKAGIKVKKWGIAGMKALDYVAAEATWRTAYETAIKNKTQKEAVNFADEAVVRTQGSGAKGDLSPVQMNALGKAATLWQTFTINNANFIARDVLGIGNPELKPFESAKRVMTYTIGSAMISSIFEEGFGVQSPQPAPINEIMKGLKNGDSNAAIALKTMMELAEIVPIGSSLKFGSHPAGPVIGYFGDLTEALAGNDVFHKDLLPKALEGDKKSMIKIAELIGKGIGVPGTGQAVKFIRGRARGENIPAALIGRFDDTKKEKKSQSSRRRQKSRRLRSR